MASRIKKGDTVVVIAGKDKGQTGKVLSVDVKNHKALVEGINMATKHAKPSAANQQGGILHQEAPIDLSNIAFAVDGKASKIGYEIKDGKKIRVAKATGKAID
jgi:large subunit ribosomal protein L24